MKQVWKNNRGEGYFDVVVLVLCAMLILAVSIKVLPAYIIKQEVNNFADELVREAEVTGRVGTETSRREMLLREKSGITPTVKWTKEGRIQLNEEISVTVTYDMNIGLFGGLGSFPITLRAEATGKGEVYWK